MTAKKVIAESDKPKRGRGRPPKNPPPPPPPPPPVADEDGDDDDDDDDDDESEESGDFLSKDTARQQLLDGVDEESRLQNKTMDRVLERRGTTGGRVPWNGQDYQKYNECATKCMDLFGAESEVEILRERPTQHHVALIPVHRMPKWSDVCSYIKETQWDGNAQKYKITIYTTGRRTGAVCHLSLSEDSKRRMEWRKTQEWSPQNQNQQWQEPAAVAAQWQEPAPQPQPQAAPSPQPQPPQPPWAPPQPSQQPWSPQPPPQSPWAPPQPQQPQQQQPPWAPPWQQPQPPQQPWGQPQAAPWQQQQPQVDEDEDEDDDDDDDEEENNVVSMFEQQKLADPRVQHLERTIESLNRQLKKLQRGNQRRMASASNETSMQQQWFQWQMLNGLHQSLQSMQAKLDEAKRSQAEMPMQQPQQMGIEEILQLVERLRVSQQPQPQPQQTLPPEIQALLSQLQPQQPQAAPQPTDPLNEIKRTVKQMSEVRKLMEEISPQPAQPPQPPPWMQQMAPNPGTAIVQSETTGQDGSPLKVFEMGPFRYVTDKDGKAVDFFTMAALNLDNLKNWIEPALHTLKDFKEQIKDSRQREEMQDTFRMFESMHHQVMQNQALQAQQIEQLSHRLAPGSSTLEAMRDGNVVMVDGPPPAPPPRPMAPPNLHSQPRPEPKPGVPSRQRSLLDGIANAQKALAKKQQ